MGFKLDLHEPLGQGIRRIMREQIESALKDLDCPDEKLHDGVHDARKGFKKIRALLRLVREPLGQPHYRQENRRYRDAGRRISLVRDSKVHVETLDDLCAALPEEIPAESCALARQILLDRHEQLLDQILAAGIARRRVQLVLQEGLLDLESWPDFEDDFSTLQPGLIASYGSGRKRYRASLKRPSTELLHEWRKQVKYLWYQLRLLPPLWPAIIDPFAEACHTLSSALGSDHDLALLDVELRQFEIPEEDRQTITRLIESRRHQVQLQAWDLGMRLYAETPAAFAKRHHAYWNAARPLQS